MVSVEIRYGEYGQRSQCSAMEKKKSWAKEYGIHILILKQPQTYVILKHVTAPFWTSISLSIN